MPSVPVVGSTALVVLLAPSVGVSCMLLSIGFVVADGPGWPGEPACSSWPDVPVVGLVESVRMVVVLAGVVLGDVSVVNVVGVVCVLFELLG